tara:strand:+ start:1016 stop:1975 length:960 start_codon:yes stop_codon:yes gene_type:complete
MKTEFVDEKWVSFPTLFQDEDGTWDTTYEKQIQLNEKNWMPAYKEAQRRGEVIDFGKDQKSALAYGEGSWKNKPTLDEEIPKIKNIPPEVVKEAMEVNPVLKNINQEEVMKNPIQWLVDNNYMNVDETEKGSKVVESIEKTFDVLVPSFAKNNPDLESNSKAWCAALVYQVLSDTGNANTDIKPESEEAYNKIRAKEYLKVGKSVTEPKYGDLVIISKKKNGTFFGKKQYHVAFYAGGDKDSLILLGGNQGYEIKDDEGKVVDKSTGEINFKSFSKKNKGLTIEGYRRLVNISDIEEAAMVEYKEKYGIIKSSSNTLER